ncbi:hypothetical protein ACFE04_025141 [Oxalis oulophora]
MKWMGCFASKNADSKATRVSRWRSTGIVALRDSKLKTFPDEVLDLGSSVRTLDLTRNKIVNIPTDISKLTNMQRLVMAENLIERLPMHLGKLQCLKVITLDRNKISYLPDELGLLVRLERLSISENMLEVVPETIGSLRNLSLLDLSNNKLKSLPESIGSCFSLEELQANDNLIEHLPASICNLVHLKSLCLNNNKVSQIPKTLLKDCKMLQNISLHSNPIVMDQFQMMEGFQEFEERRKKKFDKQIDSNVMISSKGLGEGIKTARRQKLTGGGVSVTSDITFRLFESQFQAVYTGKPPKQLNCVKTYFKMSSFVINVLNPNQVATIINNFNSSSKEITNLRKKKVDAEIARLLKEDLESKFPLSLDQSIEGLQQKLEVAKKKIRILREMEKEQHGVNYLHFDNPSYTYSQLQPKIQH